MPIAPAAPAPGPSLTAINMPAPPSAPIAPTPGAPASTTAPPATDHGPAPTPNKGLDEMFERIGEQYGQDPSEAGKPAPKKATPKTESKSEEKEVESPTTEEGKAAAPEKKAEAKPEEKPSEAKTTDKKEKVNPWKLNDENKARAAKAEAEVVELRKLIPNEAARKAEIEKVTKLETQNRELLEHIRFLDYQNHPEFKEKYEKPYADKFSEVWNELSGAPIMDGESERKVEPADLLKLGNLPAHMLVKEAKARFGEDLGPWVAERVRELRNLNKAKFDALEKAKKDGAEFQQKAQESASIEEKQRNDFLAATYEKSLQDLDTHSVYGDYFKPKEGDDEWNSKIEKGNAFVKKAWEQSPLEKGISAEEQAARVKRQAKLQRFAASFSVQQLQIARLKAQVAERDAKLKQYESSTPDTDGGSVEANGTPKAGATLDDMFDKYAKPGSI